MHMKIFVLTASLFEQVSSATMLAFANDSASDNTSTIPNTVLGTTESDFVFIPRSESIIRQTDAVIRSTIHQQRVDTIRTPYRLSGIEFWSVNGNVTEIEYLEEVLEDVSTVILHVLAALSSPFDIDSSVRSTLLRIPS